MAISIAYLGPQGTHSETAALSYCHWLEKQQQQGILYPYPSIGQAIAAVDREEVALAVVPVENSVEGGVAITLDTLWQRERLQIQQAMVLDIVHALFCLETDYHRLNTLYSHPQALSQCQKWIEQHLPDARLIPTPSTSEALRYLQDDALAGAIASPRAGRLYNLPIRVAPINDYPDNRTRFWVLGLEPSFEGNYVSLAFVTPNLPGSLLKPLKVFANHHLNLSRIESRPTKQTPGEYLFFVDLEGNYRDPQVKTALEELLGCTDMLKIFGSYDLLAIAAEPSLNSAHL